MTTPTPQISEREIEAAIAAWFEYERNGGDCDDLGEHLKACLSAASQVRQAGEQGWQPIESQPDFDNRPTRQFIRIEGSRHHSDYHFGRVYCGEAYIRHPNNSDEMLGYRRSDIERLCADGDIDLESAKVTHWQPFTLSWWVRAALSSTKAEKK